MKGIFKIIIASLLLAGLLILGVATCSAQVKKYHYISQGTMELGNGYTRPITSLHISKKPLSYNKLRVKLQKSINKELKQKNRLNLNLVIVLSDSLLSRELFESWAPKNN